MNTALTAQPKSPRLIIGLCVRYEAAIYQVEIAPTTLSGLEIVHLIQSSNRHILKVELLEVNLGSLKVLVAH